MSTTVCLGANCVAYPEGGGHFWAYLNWALGLRAVGCRVIWLEAIVPGMDADAALPILRERLAPYGLGDAVALLPSGGRVPPEVAQRCVPLEAALESDLFLNVGYALFNPIVSRFRRSALIDIDPGLFQIWLTTKQMDVAAHDVYFTTGETVGTPGSAIPDAGLTWHYTPPCVSIGAWPVVAAAKDAPFTTVSQWYGQAEWVGDAESGYPNDKRSGFLPFLDLPRHTAQPLELSLCLADDDEPDRQDLLARGWRIRHAWDVSRTPGDYQRYIQASRGEFSSAKPSCVRLGSAWVSDRTLCYLASGKPAIVQHTGPSRFLPDGAGLFRFTDLRGAIRSLEAVAADYDTHARLARALVEERFEAAQVARRVLERALG
jgi:hypothetical protein